MSTGLSELTEIANTVSIIKTAGNPLALLQCTSQYPSAPEHIGVNVINEFREKFNCAVGLSDHSGTIYPGLAAISQRIQVLEVHISLSREMFGPDVIASITTAELKQLVDGIRYIETMINNPVNKSTPDPQTLPLREMFMKSIFTSHDIKQGDTFTREGLTTKKPGTGIPANEINQVIGKKAQRDIAANTLLKNDDLE